MLTLANLATQWLTKSDSPWQGRYSADLTFLITALNLKEISELEDRSYG
jgi:hypothetical protein